MSPEPTSPAPVRVRLRYAAFETFIEKFAPNVTRGGVFLASREPRPVGEVFQFEVLLAGGEVALAGEGKVTWVRAFDPAAPHKPHGMGVQFLRLDAPSRAVVNQMLARKAAAASGAVRATGAASGSAGLGRGRNGLRSGPGRCRPSTPTSTSPPSWASTRPGFVAPSNGTGCRPDALPASWKSWRRCSVPSRKSSCRRPRRQPSSRGCSIPAHDATAELSGRWPT